MSITPFDLQQMLSRLTANKVRQSPALVAEQITVTHAHIREKKLHERILSYCALRQWLVIHSRMDMPTTVGIGVPDFVILTQGARTLLVEAKAGVKKPTPAQLAWLAWAAKLGYRGAVCRTFEEFLKFVEGEWTAELQSKQ